MSVSKRSINRAGDLLRGGWNQPGSRVELGEVTQAIDIVWEFRASFQDPLTKVVMGGSVAT
ncbi:MAG TPA: hypothetical protein VNF73_02790 [Candidatus Saccharimonadales bacterium]|nr:hypothetical protein [Candidatus Saccharimonadales bacterium]